MTFYEYMQQQTKRNDAVGYVATEMEYAVKLFPSKEFKNSSVEEWQEIICGKYSNQIVYDGFAKAIEEFREVQNESD